MKIVRFEDVRSPESCHEDFQGICGGDFAVFKAGVDLGEAKRGRPMNRAFYFFGPMSSM